MEFSQDIELFRQLVCHWEQVEGLASTLQFNQYQMAFEELQAITNNIDRTKAIVEEVMHQFYQLGRSPEWLLGELVFETQAERIGDRQEWLRTVVAAEEASDDRFEINGSLRI